MKYPTLGQVEAADTLQLARWYRFLPSPGTSGIESADFEEILQREIDVMDKIVERFIESGGMTPKVSKAIGWDKR